MVVAKKARIATKVGEKNSNGGMKAAKESVATGEIPLGKHLASTEKKVRDGAIKSLARFLEQAGTEQLNQAEMAKLWKGLFYCFWMSDKPLVQQALAQELADILLKIRIDTHAAPQEASSSSSSSPSPNTLAPLDFLEGFFDAMVREWTGIDKWRVPKFLLLFRRFVNAAFRFLAREQWNAEGVDRFNAMLLKESGPLNANNPKVSKGVTFHLLDIYLEELNAALLAPEPRRSTQGLDEAEEATEETTSCPTISLMTPFVHMAAFCFDAATYERIMEKIFSPLLEDCLVRTAEVQLREAERETEGARSSKRKRRGKDTKDDEDSEDEDDADSSVQFLAILKATEGDALDLRKDIFEALFAEASKPEANGARRKKIYVLFRQEEERIEEEEEEEEEDGDDEDTDQE